MQIRENRSIEWDAFAQEDRWKIAHQGPQLCEEIRRVVPVESVSQAGSRCAAMLASRLQVLPLLRDPVHADPRTQRIGRRIQSPKEFSSS